MEEPLTNELLNAMPLWRLLQIGLRDLRKQEQTPNCQVSMGDWLTIEDDGVCVACLAGSVLYHSLGQTDHHQWLSTLGAGKWQSMGWMRKLNSLRCGWVSIALDPSGRRSSRDGPVPDRHIPVYNLDRRGWWRAQLALLRALVEHNL